MKSRTPRWRISAYYNQSGKTPGQLAMIVTHRSQFGFNLELEVFRERKDIGRIVVQDFETAQTTEYVGGGLEQKPNSTGDAG